MRRSAATAAPVEKSAAPKAAPEVLGTAWLAQHINEVAGTNYTSYQLRILIRKLVKDGVLQRGEGRYEFKGPRDPQVLAIVKAVKAGGVKEAQSDRVEKAKAAATEKPTSSRRSRKPAADAPPAPRRSRRAAKPAAEDDDDVDLDEI